MLIATIIFLLLFGLCYPLTFKLALVPGGWRLWWLPRVFGGYSRPLLLRQKPISLNPSVGVSPGKLTRHLLRASRWYQVDIRVKLGYGDNPAAAALLCGGLYAALGMAAALVQTRLSDTLKEPRLDVALDHQQKGLFLQGECIFSVSFGDIIGKSLANVDL